MVILSKLTVEEAACSVNCVFVFICLFVPVCTL